MHSSLVSKIEKARIYAEERDRISIQSFQRFISREPQQL